jgi:hypothetical protein
MGGGGERERLVVVEPSSTPECRLTKQEQREIPPD